MSVLIDSSVTIYEVIQNIKDGKYVMPAFQRQYVWSRLKSCGTPFFWIIRLLHSYSGMGYEELNKKRRTSREAIDFNGYYIS